MLNIFTLMPEYLTSQPGTGSGPGWTKPPKESFSTSGRRSGTTPEKNAPWGGPGAKSPLDSCQTKGTDKTEEEQKQTKKQKHDNYFQKLLRCLKYWLQRILFTQTTFGSSGNRFRLFWTVSDRFWPVSDRLESFSDRFGPFLDRFGSFSDHFGPFQSISSHFRMSKTLKLINKFQLARAGAWAGPATEPNRAVRPQPWPIEILNVLQKNWNENKNEPKKIEDESKNRLW